MRDVYSESACSDNNSVTTQEILQFPTGAI